MDSDSVDYYATFDNYKVGTVHGDSILDTLILRMWQVRSILRLQQATNGDNNASYFYQGAMDVLQQYIDSGKLL